MLVLAAAPPHTFSLPISLNSLDRKGVRLLRPRDSQLLPNPDAGTDDTAPGDSTELKWEFDEDSTISHPRDQDYLSSWVGKVVRWSCSKH